MATSKSFLKQIYPTDATANKAEIDIIAVHGLDPGDNPNHATSTWTASNGKLWLKDFLPHRAKNIRVLLYGYNASAVFNSSVVGVHGAAENLINYLRIERKDAPDRPIVWIAHSLGGIVVKKAIITAYVGGDYFRSIHDATRGVIFFGTPHHGGHGATRGDRVATIVRALSGDVRNNILEALRKDSMFAEDINRDFKRRANALGLRVLTFMESLPIAKHIGLIVPPSSAALDWGEPAEIQVRMEATHRTICKFKDPDDLYDRVEKNILELLAFATSSSDDAPTSWRKIAYRRSHEDQFDQPSQNSLDSAFFLTKTRSASVASSSSDEAEYGSQPRGLVRSRPPNVRSGGSWYEAFGGLRLLFATRSATPSAPPSVASDERPLADPKSVWPVRMLPYPKPSEIIKRAPLFERLITASGDPGPVALYGLGGAGKTQLATRLAYWFIERDPEFSVFWIHADTAENSQRGLRNLAYMCGIVSPRTEEGTKPPGQCPPNISLTDLLVEIQRWFRTAPARKWLLVFDSAEDPDILTSPLTEREMWDGRTSSSISMLECIADNGYIVFTTKSRSAAAKYTSNGTMLEVGRLNDAEATLMLEIHVKDDLLLATPISDQQGSNAFNRRSLSGPSNRIPEYDNQRAVELAGKLDHLPLALSQAAAFMNKNRLSINAYLAKLSNDKMLAELMTRPTSQEAQSDTSSVYSTWRLSYESIRAHHGLAANVLAMMSFLDPQSIPLSLLQASFPNDIKLVDALGELMDYELVHSGSAKETYTVHRLVQATTQRWLNEYKLDSQWARAALMTISSKFPNPVEVSSWPEAAVWLPHAKKILRCPLLVAVSDSLAIATLNITLGLYYFWTGQWSLARTSTEAGYNIRVDKIGPLEPLTLEAREQLVYILRQLGHYTLAEATARDLKRYRKRTLGRKHELTLRSYQLLSFTLQDQGQYADATECAEKALKGFKDLYAVKDPLNTDLLLSTYRVGTMYQESMSDLHRSESLLSQALEGYKQRGDGAELPTSQVLYRLSYTQRMLGRYRESEKNAYASQDLRQRILGPKHPATYKSLFSAGWAILCQERYEESADIFEEIATVSKQILGEDHVYTYMASYYLAESLQGLGEYEEAKKLHERTLAGRKHVLRENHPDVLKSQVGLASILQILGDSKTALRLSLDVYKTLKKGGRVTKERAPIAWMCISNIAKIEAERAATIVTTTTTFEETNRQAQWKEAIKWGRLLVQGKERMLGSDHPETRNAVQKLTGYLRASRDQAASPSISETVSRIAPHEKDKLG